MDGTHFDWTPLQNDLWLSITVIDLPRSTGWHNDLVQIVIVAKMFSLIKLFIIWLQQTDNNVTITRYCAPFQLQIIIWVSISPIEWFPAGPSRGAFSNEIPRESHFYKYVYHTSSHFYQPISSRECLHNLHLHC